VISKSCSINKVGMIGETLREGSDQVAQEANRLALARDKKPIPLRKPIFNKNTSPTAFILLSSTGVGVYRIIMSNVIFVVSLYGYIKIICTTCKKAWRIILKNDS
jgi:hypothetical protein